MNVDDDDIDLAQIMDRLAKERAVIDSVSGPMSASDKQKLDIQTGNYTWWSFDSYTVTDSQKEDKE